MQIKTMICYLIPEIQELIKKKTTSVCKDVVNRAPHLLLEEMFTDPVFLKVNMVINKITIGFHCTQQFQSSDYIFKGTKTNTEKFFALLCLLQRCLQ